MKPCLWDKYSFPCLSGRNLNYLMIINSSQEHHCCLLSSLFLWQKVNSLSRIGSWREKFGVQLRHLGTLPESSFQCFYPPRTCPACTKSLHFPMSQCPNCKWGQISLPLLSLLTSLSYLNTKLWFRDHLLLHLSAAEHRSTSPQRVTLAVPCSVPDVQQPCVPLFCSFWHCWRDGFIPVTI